MSVRRVGRMRIESAALLRSGTGSRIEASLFDISEFGCAVRVFKVGLEIGRIYSLKTNGVELLTAKVIWVRNSFAGLEFLPALHPAVAEHLARSSAGKKVGMLRADDELLTEIVRERAAGIRRAFDPPCQ
jgi:hypothetical protein